MNYQVHVNVYEVVGANLTAGRTMMGHTYTLRRDTELLALGPSASPVTPAVLSEQAFVLYCPGWGRQRQYKNRD
jgi:hypothetical protein